MGHLWEHEGWWPGEQNTSLPFLDLISTLSGQVGELTLLCHWRDLDFKPHCLPGAVPGRAEIPEDSSAHRVIIFMKF